MPDQGDPDGPLGAPPPGPAPSRALGWGTTILAASALVACVAGAVRAPSSWWGVAAWAAFVGTMVALRPVVPARYRAGWLTGTAFTSAAAALGAAAYAFAVEPFGPRPAVAVVCGILCAAGLAVLFGGNLATVRHSPSVVWSQHPDPRDLGLRDRPPR
ncbi:MAG TPA: hypothetical protein VF519_08335 [Mycobacteriales bacterium]|jgi:hypothetical protein